MVPVLTGDAGRGLAALGGAQVAPSHTETPVVLRAMEILHLLTGHIYHHLTHLQPWNNREEETEVSAFRLRLGRFGFGQFNEWSCAFLNVIDLCVTISHHSHG